MLSAVAVASLTAVAIGGLAVSDLNELRDARAEELSTALPYTNALHSIGLTAKATANDERGFLLTGDQEFAVEVDERLAKIDGLVEEAVAASASEEEATIVTALKAGIDTWAASLRSEFELHATDPAAAVAQAMGPGRDLRKAYEAQLAEGLEAADARLLEGAGYDETVNAAIRNMIIICVLGVALAIGMGFLVTRSVTGGIGRLRETAGRLAAGDLTVETGVDQKDEIGQAAASLDSALVSLRTVMSSVVESADAVAASSEELSASSAQISASAEETSAQSGVVSSAAEEVSRSVQTVAAGAEEMGASIREIASNAAEASEVAGPRGDRCRDHDRHGRQAGRVLGRDRQRRQGHHLDRRADEPAGAQRHHRGRAGR